MPRAFDGILVPQGAEEQAVRRGMRRAQANIEILPLAMGSEATRRRLKAALRQGWLGDRQRLLVLGVAGSLTAQLRVGDGVVYQSVVGPDGEEIPLGEAGEMALGVSRLMAQVPQLQPVKAVSCDRLIHQAPAKQALQAQTGAQVVDMEAAAIAQILVPLGIAIATVRVISDDAQGDLPDLSQATGADGQLQGGKMAIAFLRQPRAAVRLIRGSLQALQQLEAITAQLLASRPQPETNPPLGASGGQLGSR